MYLFKTGFFQFTVFLRVYERYCYDQPLAELQPVY